MIMSVIAQGAPSSNAACVCWCVCWKLQKLMSQLRACNCGASCRTCVPHPESCAQAPPVWCSRSLLMRRGIITKPPQNGPWRTQATPRASHALLKYIPALRFWSKVLALYAHKKKLDIRLDLRSLWWGRAKNCPVQII